MVSKQQISEAAAAIRNGELVAFPTETVYGLGANSLEPLAVAKIFELKGRPRFDPLIVHIADSKDLQSLVVSVPPLAQQLAQTFWPGPLSLVLQKRTIVPDIVTAGQSTVAVRCPDNEIAQQLIRAAGVPVAAPSANRFGMISPTTAKHVIDQFGDSALHVLDGGPCRVGVESTVISFVDANEGHPRLLRQGGVTLEQIESITGPMKSEMHDDVRPSSPGQLTKHYSPRTALVLQEDSRLQEHMAGKQNIGLLAFESADSFAEYSAIEILSPAGCLRESAANLFAAMRRLDNADLDLIVAQSVPEHELGRAIMDRLRRAAAE